MKRLALISLLAVAGCAGDPMIFYKPDMTQRSYAKDSYECEKDARQVRYGRYESAVDFAVRCMQARGWAYVPASVLTPQTVQRIREQWNDQPP